MTRPVALAGWPLRHASLAQFEALLGRWRPPLIEISKDFLRDDVPLKALGTALDRIRPRGGEVAFAGTTDLVGGAGLPWARYRRYVAVQIAQARFLDCSWVRLFVGPESVSVSVAALVGRVNDLCDDVLPMRLCLEIHAGMESDAAVLAALLAETPAAFVVDFENMRRAGLTTDTVTGVMPLGRIAYFHQRNLGHVWVEDPGSRTDEATWAALCPETPFLWEPKTIEGPGRIEELYGEYRTAH